MNFDYQIFELINGLAGKNWLLDWLGIFSAVCLIYIIVAIVLIYILAGKSNLKNKIIQTAIILAPAALAYVINVLIGWIYFRPRPFVGHEVVELVLKSPLSKSFPSDHAAISFVLAFAVYFVNKKLGLILLVLAFLVSLGRVYVGIHYPLDIVAGAVVGFGSVMLVKSLNIFK